MKCTYTRPYWKGKPLKLTRHANEELEQSGKSAEAILEILQHGEHAKESNENSRETMKKWGECCHVCGRKMVECNIDFRGVQLRGWKCKCGEEVFPFEEVLRYEVIKGRRNSDIRSVTKMGNSLVVSIPTEYAKQMNIKKGSKLLFFKAANFLKLMPVPRTQ